MNYNKQISTYIRTLYSKEYSALMMSFYNYNLSFNFMPYVGKDHRGQDYYESKLHQSTSVNYEAAAFLYISAMAIIDGNQEYVEAVLQCNNKASLTFRHRTDIDNQIETYLIIEKNNATIPFRFPTRECRIRKDGKVVTKIIPSGLGVFAMVIDGYLTGIGANLHLRKLTEEMIYDPKTY
jgi:hypothetical protein